MDKLKQEENFHSSPLSSSSLTGIVLAGGLSSRFGSCKSKLEVARTSLLKKNYLLLKKYCQSVYISCREGMGIENFPCIHDTFICYAPLSGIYSALEYSKTSILVLSCDLPFIHDERIQELIQEREKALLLNKNLLMTTFRQEGTSYIESLVAIYEHNARTRMKKALDEGFYTLHKIIPEHTRHHIITSDSKAFFNINYPQDLAKAEEIYSNTPNYLFS